MALFNFGKKKEGSKSTCSCSGGCCGNVQSTQENGASVKILGPGCPNCNKLEAATIEALKELGMDTTIDHVTDFTKIAAYGVMSTPALVIDGKVASYGKVLKKEEVIELLKKIRG